MYNCFSWKRLILTGVLCSSLAVGGQAETPSSSFNRGQQGKYSAETKIDVHDVEPASLLRGNHPAVGTIMFPSMAKHLPPSELETIPAQVRKEYDANYKDGVLAVVKDDTNKWGLMGIDGKWLIAPTYKSISYMGKGVFTANGKKGTVLVDKRGNQAVWPESDVEAVHFFKDKGRFGIQDREGHIIVEPTYKAILVDFSEGLAFVKDSKGKKVAIDERGRVQFTAPYDVLLPYHNGLAEYQRKVSHFNWGSILVGAIVGASMHYDYIYYNTEVMPLTYDGVKRGYIDRTGTIVVDSKNDAVYPMTAFGTFVRNKGKLGFVNRKGQYIIEPGNYSLDDAWLDDMDGFASLKDKKSGKWGVFSIVDGAQVVDFAYDGVQFLGARRLVLTKDTRAMLVNQETGELAAVFPVDMKWMPFLLESYTWCWNDEKEYTIIDKNGQAQYSFSAGDIREVKEFRNGHAPVRTKDGWGIVDYQGHWILEPKYKDITMI